MSADGGSPEPPPRLLVLTPDYPPARGGIQALVDGLLRELRGMRTRVVALDGPGAARYDERAGRDVRRVRADARLGPARIISLNAAALAEARSFRPQLVLGLHIVTSPASSIIRRLLGSPVLQYYHANEIGDKPRLSRFAAAHADASIAVSSYTAGLLAGVGVAAEGVRLIPPGVEIPTDRSPLASERPTILTVSRLVGRYKGHDVLIEALELIRERVPDVEWVVVGEGPLRGELEALARQRGVADSIRFLGAVGDEERNDWLRRADVFAMPSRLPGGGLAGEGFGIAFLEAGAYGKPVVAGNVGGALDAVVDGRTGLLVDPTDPRAVGEAITGLLVDRERAQRLGAQGAERARSLEWAVIAERVRELLLELLGGSS